MRANYYFAAYDDSGCIIGCEHEHTTVVAATSCISWPGGYVIAVENNKARALTDEEEQEFCEAMGYCKGEAEKFRFVLRLQPRRSSS
jgi:hypothetical protein